MKKILIVAVTVLGLAGFFAFYTSCKKNNTVVENSNNPISNQSFNKRTTGTEAYYSKDLETNTSYQLTVTKNADHEITIHRETISINPEEPNAKVYYGYDDDVNVNIPNENTIVFKSQDNIDTYLIPFNPEQDIQNFISGGDKYKFVGTCTCELGITSPYYCQAEVTKLQNGTIKFYCTPKNCQTCKLHITRIKMKDSSTTNLPYSGGFMVITGSSINEI
jgi:hypothetical protein